MKSFLFLAVFLLLSCSSEEKPSVSDPKVEPEQKEQLPFSEFSSDSNTYQLFNSVDAINRVVEIENEYFEDFENGESRFYGTQWDPYQSSFPNYFKQDRPDSMHCTIYAIHGLKAGMSDENWKHLDSLHEIQYNIDSYAGWSIAYLLVKHFNWRAYLILDEESKEFDHCMRSYQSDQTYPVWRQPKIPLEDLMIIQKDSSKIDSLLALHEFGWGFSNQGYHTWITRYNILKECNWAGSPSVELSDIPLFIKRPFNQYHDYKSHVVVFPPKKNQELINYTDSKGLKQGKWFDKRSNSIVHYKEGKKHGMYLYAANDDLSGMQIFYQNDKPVYSGFPGMIYQYLNPPKESFCRVDSIYGKFYYSDGSLLSEGMLVDQKYSPEHSSGIHKIYYKNGSIRGIVDYEKNTVKYFDQSGKLQSTDAIRTKSGTKVAKKYPK